MNAIEVVEKAGKVFGGIDKMLDAMEARHRAFNTVWNQDADKIGRILRAHLAVEHFLTAYIQAMNPKLGSLDDARLTFANKLALLGDDNKAIELLKPGLVRLNQIRNRLAHKLQMDVDEEDKNLMLSIALFKAWHDESKRQNDITCDDPVFVVEEFAKLAANFLQSSASPDSELWSKAFSSEPLE
jgi:hypothetical protein